MNYPKTEMSKRVEEVKRQAETIVNKGVCGKGFFKLEKTLETHQHIKILLEELEYTLQKDIPEEDILAKIASIEKEIKLIQEETER